MKQTLSTNSEARQNLNSKVGDDLDLFQKPRRDPTSRESIQSPFKPWRVFVNHVDSYHGRKLADLLTEQVYVNPQSVSEEVDEEEEEVDEEDERIDDEEHEVGDEKFRATSATDRIPKKYEVIGTTSDPESTPPEDVTMIIKDPGDRDVLLAELMKCGIVIYDITHDKHQVDEARWALKAIVRELERMEKQAPKAFKRNEDVRYFVLISTLMTWALTKPLNPKEPELPFTEEDFRKRKPHPNFKEHVQCEKEVTTVVRKKLNLNDKLKTLVICSGITYGDEQGPLHHLFKMAWQNAPFLPILGRGDNKMPLLHVRDMLTVVLDALQNWPPLRYIVATEQELITQNTIVKKISRAFTTGKTKNIEQEEAFLLPEITQRTYDLMTMDLNIDPVYIVDRISWHLDAPFRDSINAIVREYRAARNLYPVKIIVLGPPASGKSIIARYLARHYGIHYVHVKSLIEDTIRDLTSQIEDAMTTVTRDDGGEGGEGDRPDDDDDDDEDLEGDEETVAMEEPQELLDMIQQNLQRNKGRLDDVLLNKLFLRKLRSNESRNQGYVMDGYPKTLDQATMLFSGEHFDQFDEVEGEDIDEERPNIVDDATDSIMPELVVSLEASEEFLKERIIQLPEREIQGTHYTEEHTVRRLKEYRRRNTDENTPLQFFDEIEIHPLFIAVEDDVCPDMFPSIHQCLVRIGPPRNYGLTTEEAREARKHAEEEKRRAENAAKMQQEREILEQKRKRQKKMEEWTSLREKLKEEEEERLCLMGMPLRHYLVKYIFPTLTQGLIEVANLRPDDPIDFLAEYLFKENPEGKMFEPDFTETMQSVLDVITKFQDDVLAPEELDDRIMDLLRKQNEQPDTSESSASSEMDTCGARKFEPCFTYDDTTSGGETATESDKTGHYSQKTV